MKRRDSIKTFILGSASLPFAIQPGKALKWLGSENIARGADFESDWDIWSDMSWVGPAYWGNRLQDWEIVDGQVMCNASCGNRNLYLLTVQNTDGEAEYSTSVEFKLALEDDSLMEESYFVGVRIGSKGPYEDYQSAAVFGEGYDVGVLNRGTLKIGDKVIPLGRSVAKNQICRLELKVSNSSMGFELMVRLLVDDEEILRSEESIPDAETLKGSFALVSSVGDNQHLSRSGISATFSRWTINSEDLSMNEDNVFGPICFAQYTTNRGKLKLTAQLSPIERIPGHSLEIQFMESGDWKTYQSGILDRSGRAQNYVFDDWDTTRDTPYRLALSLPMKDGSTYRYVYDGTVAKESTAEEIKVAVFSCNFHFGFPDADVPEYMDKLKPDLCLFLGDQFYENTGNYGVVYDDEFDKLCLDYLRKWYMFGWSYRDIFRHIPCATLPDDHDVFHGNIWGESGKSADTSEGFRASAQDSGGYKMSPEWVNMVQYTQTSHLPDAYDATPVDQGIGVYYGHWNYSWLSFAILEDRKFKSAPGNVLPEEAQIWNGFVTNPDFDIKKTRDIDAELLGARQEEFLEDWVSDWSEGAEMKVVLSQTNFAAVQTVPRDWPLGKAISNLEPPKAGVYLKDDVPTADMDTNAWPIGKRDKAVELIRKAFAFHIAGDQHLASYIQYGVDQYGDSGYAFAGPALSNIFVRRFWPEVDSSTHSEDSPAYLGNHEDGFGNKFTALGIANPQKTGQAPEILSDRSTGYGIVTFNKNSRTIKTDCYRRKIDPSLPEAQFPDWPITIEQMDNYGRMAEAWLPTLKVESNIRPVIKVYDESKELVYAMRMNSSEFTPKVFAKGRYDILAELPEDGLKLKLNRIKSRKKKKKSIELNLADFEALN